LITDAAPTRVATYCQTGEDGMTPATAWCQGQRRRGTGDGQRRDTNKSGKEELSKYNCSCTSRSKSKSIAHFTAAASQLRLFAPHHGQRRTGGTFFPVPSCL